MPEAKLRGVFCPHMVPLDERGRINEPELRRLVEWLIQRGVDGLYPNGSTGEFTRFNEAERREIVRIACEQAAGRVTILAGASECDLATTLDACEYYHSIGAHAVAIVPPIYYPLRQPNVYEYFAQLARHSPIDVAIYKIPQFTTDVAVSTVERLAELPRIVGMKDSSRDFPGYLNLMHRVRRVRPDFSFLIGCEEILVPSLIMGGDGATLCTAGIVPELVCTAAKQVREGNYAEAIRLQYALLDMIEQVVFGVQFPEGVRVALELRGFRMGAPRLPLAAEEAVDTARVRSALHRLLGALGCPLDADAPMPQVCAGPRLEADPEGYVEDVVRRVIDKLRQAERR